MPNQLHSHPRKMGKDSRACRVCNTCTGLIRKYQLMICRRCFREQANLIGFHKYRWGARNIERALGMKWQMHSLHVSARPLAPGYQWDHHSWEARSRPLTPTLYTELNFLRLYPNWTLVVVWHSFLIRYESVVLSLLLYIVFSNSNFFQLFKRNYSIFLIYLIGVS